MKKLIIFGAALAALGMYSCGSGAGKGEGLDTFYTQAQIDTLFNLYGTGYGMEKVGQFNYMKQQDSTISKEDFLKGFMYAINADTNSLFLQGMQEGLQVAQSLKQQESRGVTVNRAAFLKHFRESFMQEETNDSIMQALIVDFNARAQALEQAIEAYNVAKIEASEESQANILRGQQYIDSVKSANQNAVVTETGVVYTIDSVGEGNKLTPADRVYLEIQGESLNGVKVPSYSNTSVFVSSVKPAAVAKVLENLAVGGAATVIVPGKEAYGANVRKTYGLGPNETIVYTIKVTGLYEEPKN